METVRVSPKYQVVIPKRVREERNIRPGDRLAVIVKHGILHLVPVRPFAASKGMLRGAMVAIKDVRDHSDRM